MAKHLFEDFAEVTRHDQREVEKIGDKIRALVEQYRKTGPNIRQFKVWLGKLRKAYSNSLYEPMTRGRPRENDFVNLAIRQAYTVKDLESEANYVLKVLKRAQDADSWQAAIDVTDMHVRSASTSLKRIADRLEEAVKDLMPERFKFGAFTIVDKYGLSRRQAKPWFEAVVRASRLLEKRGFKYLLYGDLVLTTSNSWGGLYQVQGDLISLDLGSGPSTKRLVDVLVHELGHRLWFKFLDGGARDRFAAPWISRDEATRQVWEQYRDVFDMPPNEPREAFELVWNSQYDFTKFQRWIRESPERLARWMHYARSLYTGPEPGHEVIRNNKLNRKAFEHAAQKVALWMEPHEDRDVQESRAKSLERFRARQERLWRNTSEYTGKMLTYREVEDMLEPHGSEFHVNPKAKKGGVLRKLLEIRPVDFSVTPYGNMNRREDFAVVFEEVLLGKNKDRAVQERLQAVLPKGRVLSSADDRLKLPARGVIREALQQRSRQIARSELDRGCRRSDTHHYPGKPFDPAAVAGPRRKNPDPRAQAFAAAMPDKQHYAGLLRKARTIVKGLQKRTDAEAMHAEYKQMAEWFRPLGKLLDPAPKLERADQQRQLQTALGPIRCIRRMTEDGYLASIAYSSGITDTLVSDRASDLVDCVAKLLKYWDRIEGYEAVERTFKHGPFTIQNKYGYAPAELASVLALLDEVQAKLTAAGFKRLLYGDVTLGGKTGQHSGAANYSPNRDDITIDMDKSYGAGSEIYSLAHELGHRYWFVVMNDAERDAYEQAWSSSAPNAVDLAARERYWDAWKGSGYNARRAVQKVPKDEQDRFRQYLAERRKHVAVQPRGDLREEMVQRQFVMPKQRYYYLGGQPQSVTRYGSTSVKEDFAEVFAYYVKGLKLTADALERFSKAVSRSVRVRANRDPRAQAFWQFVDKAAAQVDGWPEWMVHREPVAAEDAPAMPFKVGDVVKHGKYKNKIARIKRFGKNDKGQVTVLLEPVPKGRKKDKELGLFKIWTTPDKVEAVAVDATLKGRWTKHDDGSFFHVDEQDDDTTYRLRKQSGQWRLYVNDALASEFGPYRNVREAQRAAVNYSADRGLRNVRRLFEKFTKSSGATAAKIDKQASVTAATDELYHTTSLKGLAGILQSRTFKPHPHGGFISFSARPQFGDISGNDAVIVLDREALRNRVMPVEYTERWYDRYPEHAAYVAGEGWREQYQEPEDCYDEEGWADEECVERAYRDAELDAFLDKRGEREWVGRAGGDLRLPADAFKRVVVPRAKLEVVEALLKKLGLRMPVTVLRGRAEAGFEHIGKDWNRRFYDRFVGLTADDPRAVGRATVGPRKVALHRLLGGKRLSLTVEWDQYNGELLGIVSFMLGGGRHERYHVDKLGRFRPLVDQPEKAAELLVRALEARAAHAAALPEDEADEATAIETPKKYRNRTNRCPPGHRSNEKETCIDMKERRKKRRWEQQQKARERRLAGR